MQFHAIYTTVPRNLHYIRSFNVDLKRPIVLARWPNIELLQLFLMDDRATTRINVFLQRSTFRTPEGGRNPVGRNICGIPIIRLTSFAPITCILSRLPSKPLETWR